MTAKRRYRLLCPIARSLDALGDRWALLILRDLHAGPARFQELEAGLGIAPNLLSTRLAELADAGLIEKSTERGQAGYRLTELGRHTDRMLWELARFGARLDRDPDPREPGNLRTIALPLRLLLEAVPDRPAVTARLLVGDDRFTIRSSAEGVDVAYGDVAEAFDGDVDVVVRTDYEAFLDAGEGRMPLDEFAAEHLEVVAGADHADAFLGLMASAISGD